MDDGNGDKMKSRGKLGNDEKVKFVGLKKVWDGEGKLVGSDLYGNYYFQFHFSIPVEQTNPYYYVEKN